MFLTFLLGLSRLKIQTVLRGPSNSESYCAEIRQKPRTEFGKYGT